MEIEQELANITPKGETLLTIGVFDGVHAGHRYLLEKLQQRAAEKNLLSGVVTFNHHHSPGSPTKCPGVYVLA
jgi:riboflavin kinase/FMN adenylyltransferase